MITLGIGMNRIVKIPLDLERSPVTFVAQAHAFVKKRPFVPFHGRTTGFILNYPPDCAVRFDIDGRPVEYFDRSYTPDAIQLFLGRRKVPAKTFARVLGIGQDGGERFTLIEHAKGSLRARAWVVERTANMLEAIDLTKNPMWAFMQIAQAYNARLMEFAAINIGAFFKFAESLSKANSPHDFANIIADHVRDQFEVMSEQVEELSSLIQKASPENQEEIECGLGD